MVLTLLVIWNLIIAVMAKTIDNLWTAIHQSWWVERTQLVLKFQAEARAKSKWEEHMHANPDYNRLPDGQWVFAHQVCKKREHTKDGDVIDPRSRSSGNEHPYFTLMAKEQASNGHGRTAAVAP